MQVVNNDGYHIATLTSVVTTSSLGAMFRWRVQWTDFYDMNEPPYTAGSLHMAQQYIEGVVERQEHLAALKRL